MINFIRHAEWNADQFVAAALDTAYESLRRNHWCCQI